jgi:hypothetical protein
MNSKMRKQEELGKHKRAHEKSKQFDDEVKRVLTESRPEEWTAHKVCRVDDLKLLVWWCHCPGDKKCIMKKGELWARWTETKGISEHDQTCLDPGDKITTMGSEPIKAGWKAL